MAIPHHPIIGTLAGPARRVAVLRPLTLAAAAAVVAISLHLAAAVGGSWPGWLVIPVDPARTFLASIAGTMITATIVLFWVRGLLVSTHAARMPNRILSDYLTDRYQQWAMGTMVAVFTFSVVGLVVLSFDQASEANGAMLVVTAAALAVVALLVIVHSVDAGVRSLHEERVMRRVTEAALEVIERDYPAECEPAQGDENLVPPWDADLVKVRSRRIGWVRSIDEAAILRTLPPDSTCWLGARVGDFVSPATALCRIDGVADDDVGAVDLEDAFEIGDTRDPERDLSLALRNLVDVALGSLVDGTDPTTARAAVAHLGALLRPIVAWDGPARVVEADGRLLVRGPTPDYVHYLDDSFTDLAKAGADPVTARRMLSVLEELVEVAEECDRTERAQVLRRHIDFMVVKVEQNGADATEVDWIEGRRSA